MSSPVKENYFENAFLGILMLDTNFPRVPGDVGSEHTFDFPVKYKVISDASVEKIVSRKLPSEDLCQSFIEVAVSFEREGAVAIITSCGFLSVIQQRLAESVNIPVCSSSLIMASMLRTIVGNKRIAIITANASEFSDQVLESAQLTRNQAIVYGMEGCIAFRKLILESNLGQQTEINKQAITTELNKIAQKINSQGEEVGAILLECTNLQPYVQPLQLKTGLPVIGIYHAANLLWQMVTLKQF